ncbi:Uncharacterised protein [Vibrio cholerae]|uniref:Uncharacterized protein n=1 Tax=Vibrio cholerae TaxID=666 RepID=A0A655SIS2_VIBCL|nr:Uncharacterised protein [Vibrio cholerae]CSA33235.1 Uncharacterised protein [Vibrio cholerae]CSA81264.1 Uncharacterised protein [Vibrio cholerae]CSB22902.1 Uncharacterised protein [Vibrio cholerae]CSB44994.1 Uncharacterised protein [Vibrio cholerae]
MVLFRHAGIEIAFSHSAHHRNTLAQWFHQRVKQVIDAISQLTHKTVVATGIDPVMQVTFNRFLDQRLHLALAITLLGDIYPLQRRTYVFAFCIAHRNTSQIKL